jgi:microcystin-dependent protein
MSQVFIGQVMLFGGNFAPKGFALCNGQLLPIAQNTALFSLLGTNYGGDGKSTFALPDLQGRAVVGQGKGPGLSAYTIGETTGTPNVTLTTLELPAHNHSFVALTGGGTGAASTNNLLAQAVPSGTKQQGYSATFYSPIPPGNSSTALSPLAVGMTGGNQPHENMQPYLTITMVIAMQGVFPSRP